MYYMRFEREAGGLVIPVIIGVIAPALIVIGIVVIVIVVVVVVIIIIVVIVPCVTGIGPWISGIVVIPVTVIFPACIIGLIVLPIVIDVVVASKADKFIFASVPIPDIPVLIIPVVGFLRRITDVGGWGGLGRDRLGGGGGGGGVPAWGR